MIILSPKWDNYFIPRHLLKRGDDNCDAMITWPMKLFPYPQYFNHVLKFILVITKSIDLDISSVEGQNIGLTWVTGQELCVEDVCNYISPRFTSHKTFPIIFHICRQFPISQLYSALSAPGSRGVSTN